MKYGVRALIGLTTAVTVLATACADSSRSYSTAPVRVDSAATSANLLGGVLGTVTSTLNNLLASPVTRNTPLASDVVWTFTAGPGGAISSNPTVGLTISIPAGALDASTQFTVTALKGSAVAYRFEPHVQFDRKVVLRQNLRGTSLGGLLNLTQAFGAHFDGDALDYDSNGLVSVTEIVPALLSIFTKTASFSVGHFSGWILASGYSE